MPTIERRAFDADLEMRSTATGYHLRGYAARFDSPSNGEVVRSTAFNKTLAERDDVRLLINHDGVPLARTKSGTLTLGVDAVGLAVDAPGLDPSNPDVQRLASAMDRKDIDQMSFAFIDFTPADQRYDSDGLRNLRETKLYDTSVVTFPWYEDTQAEMNSLDAAFEVIKRGGLLTKEQRDMLIKVVVFCDDDDDILTDLNDIGETEPLPQDADTPMMQNSAPYWRLEAAKALRNRNTAA